MASPSTANALSSSGTTKANTAVKITMMASSERRMHNGRRSAAARLFFGFFKRCRSKKRIGMFSTNAMQKPRRSGHRILSSQPAASASSDRFCRAQ